MLTTLILWILWHYFNFILLKWTETTFIVSFLKKISEKQFPPCKKMTNLFVNYHTTMLFMNYHDFYKKRSLYHCNYIIIIMMHLNDKDTYLHGYIVWLSIFKCAKSGNIHLWSDEGFIYTLCMMSSISTSAQIYLNTRVVSF